MNLLRPLKNRKVLAVLGFVALLLVIALWPSSVSVDVATAKRGPMSVTVDEEGETRVHDRFVVSAPVAGEVLRIELEPGDPVRRGETVLATFQPAAPNPLDARSRAEAEAGVAAARAALGSARAERERAEAALRLARSELERNQELAEQKIVSRQDLESKETEARAAEEAMRAAEFGVASAMHQLEMAQARLLQATGVGRGSGVIEIHSPIDGVVFKRYRESEAVVPAGEPLLELGDPHHLEIVSDLLSTDAVKVKSGNAVLIVQWGGNKTLRGRVRLVEPSGFMKISALGVEEQRVNVIVDFEDPEEAWAALGDGYRVEVRVVIWEGQGVLQVPTSSLFRKGEKWAVFAVDSGRARVRTIELGQRNGLSAQVLSGLEEGDTVVVHPSDSLEDGARIARRQS
jgi:HlyD family secretion protein